MKLLLDTQILLWFLALDKRLPSIAGELIENQDNEKLISAASVWEIAIKSAIGKIKLPIEALQPKICESGFIPLSVTIEHAQLSGTLPLYHRDPFDRMLVAQCMAESARLLTTDAQLADYGSAVLLVT